MLAAPSTIRVVQDQATFLILGSRCPRSPAFDRAET